MGRPAEITPKRVEDICQVLRITGDLQLACDYIGISRQTPWYWEKKGNEVQALIDEEIQAGKRPILTDRDKAYLEFSNTARKARAEFELRHKTLVGAAGGTFDNMGKPHPKDWRASWTLLNQHNPRKYGMPRDIPPRIADPLEREQEEIEANDLEKLNGSAELIDNDPYKRVVSIMRTLVKADILPADVFAMALNGKGNGADDEP